MKPFFHQQKQLVWITGLTVKEFLLIPLVEEMVLNQCSPDASSLIKETRTTEPGICVYREGCIMDYAVLNNEFIATQAGNIRFINYDV